MIFLTYVRDDNDRQSHIDMGVYGRAGKKLKMSAHGHFEGSEMPSKVRDFRQKKLRQKSVILGPSSILILNTSSILNTLSSIFNPHPQYFLNPQSSSSILNYLFSIPAPKSRQKCGILGPKCPQKCVILGKMSARIACSFFQFCCHNS